MNIGVWIERENPRAADEFVDLIRAKFELLAKYPQMDRPREEPALADLNLRSHPVGNYLIFYRSLSDGVEIVRILHGSMDIEGIESW
ncbi:MAG: type II toxin-antitoxin system RelE/ParE family toxin [Chrysiogenetes bacterium]|nr:type II toxin-antitoxin system RelE/ParE family toxin [Chrysiogenetes bacterium]